MIRNSWIYLQLKAVVNPPEAHTALPCAAATAGLGNTIETTRHFILEIDASHIEGRQGVVGQYFYPVLDATNALVQGFILVGQAGEMGIVNPQLMQSRVQFREVFVQGVVFNVHGGAPWGSRLATSLSPARPPPLDRDQQQPLKRHHATTDRVRP